MGETSDGIPQGEEQAWMRRLLAELSDFPDVPPDEVRPRSMTLDVTLDCPYRCPACIEAPGMREGRRGAFTTATALKLIRQFADLGGEEVLFYGGEPTAHPDFPTFVRYAAGCMEKVRIVTNGAYLADRAIAEAICTAGERTDVSIRVSLNAGTPETHDALHRVEGFFPRVLEGMACITSASDRVHVGVSFLLEEANAAEVGEAYDRAAEVGAGGFWVRPKTGLHGIGPLPIDSLSAREAALAGLRDLSDRRSGPELYVEPWHIPFLERGELPDTRKPFPSCYYCAASRLVVSPPGPGQVWACTYFRAHAEFLVADLTDVELGSPEFERRRIDAIRRIVPGRDCAGVICNRAEANKAIWARRQQIDPAAG